jgi:DNA-directed RNA polymerase subunit RPC12/RpoP
MSDHEGIDTIMCDICKDSHVAHVDHNECGVCGSRVIPKSDEYFCAHCGNRLRDIKGHIIRVVWDM